MSEDIKKHISIYRNVFIALLTLTICTVGASYLNFSYASIGLFIGLLIACVKGYLVASEFMHLNNEKRFIYGVLTLTVVFFFVLLLMPLLWDENSVAHGNGAYENVSHEHSDEGHHHEGGH
jgi:caa(3)-type oxidase subunit IV